MWMRVCSAFWFVLVQSRVFFMSFTPIYAVGIHACGACDPNLSIFDRITHPHETGAPVVEPGPLCSERMHVLEERERERERERGQCVSARCNSRPSVSPEASTSGLLGTLSAAERATRDPSTGEVVFWEVQPAPSVRADAARRSERVLRRVMVRNPKGQEGLRGSGGVESVFTPIYGLASVRCVPFWLYFQ